MYFKKGSSHTRKDRVKKYFRMNYEEESLLEQCICKCKKNSIFELHQQ